MTEHKCVINSNGSKEWLVDGKLHRLDGPAVERYDGTRHWYIDGKYWTEQDFINGVIMFLFGCDRRTARSIIRALNDRT